MGINKFWASLKKIYIMKTKITFTLLLLTMSVNSFSQFILTGTHESQDYYFDLNPDISVYAIDPNGLPYYGYPSNLDSLLIDLNGDSINDVRLTAQYSNGQQWYQRFYCLITPLNDNNIAISHFDSCFNYLDTATFQYLSPIANSFSYSDTINKNSNWIDSTADIAFHDNDANYINCSYNSFSTNSKYVGVKVITISDTLFGWIKIIAPKYDSMVVQEYACNLFSTGIEYSHNQLSLEIFPNPSTGKITIKSDNTNEKDFKVEIFNSIGTRIYINNFESTSDEIDLSYKPKGLYLVKTVSGNKSVTNKIIIE